MVLPILATSCATSIDRITIKDGRQDKDHISISKTDEVELWADVNVSYMNTAEIIYTIKVFHDGRLIHSCEDDALFHHDSGGTYMLMMNSVKDERQYVRYQKKLECDFTPPELGEYRFEIDQKFYGRLFEVNKCDLILRQ